MILIVSIAFIITNCTHDEVFEEQITQNSDITVNRIDFQELKRNSNLSSKIEGIKMAFDINKELTGVAGRSDATDGSFTILTDEVVETTKDSLSTYTFRIETPTDPNAIFENFVIIPYKSNPFYIYRFYEAVPEEGKPPFTLDRAAINESQINTADFEDYLMPDMYLMCWDIWAQYTCNRFFPDPCGWMIVGEYCIEIDGGGGNSGGNTSGDTTNNDMPNGDGSEGNNEYGGGGGGNSSSDDSTQTSDDAVAVLPNQELDKNCEELNKMLNDSTNVTAPYTSIYNAINDLGSGANNPLWNDDPDEEGFSFITYPTGEKQRALEVTTTNNHSISYPFGDMVFGGVHIHADASPDLAPMFSPQDIEVLYMFATTYNYGGGTPDYSIPVHILVSTQGIYALKIDDFDLFQNLGSILNNKKKLRNFERRLNNDLDHHYDIFGQPEEGSAKEYQRDLLNFINNYDGEGSNLGLSLYKLDKAGNDEITDEASWDKLSFDPEVANPGANDIIKEKC